MPHVLELRVTGEITNKGEVENAELLESSGSKILDNRVFRTLRMIGPIGSFRRVRQGQVQLDCILPSMELSGDEQGVLTDSVLSESCPQVFLDSPFNSWA
jgi:hypothetical protein